jgi:hypothetical protein
LDTEPGSWATQAVPATPLCDAERTEEDTPRSKVFSSRVLFFSRPLFFPDRPSREARTHAIGADGDGAFDDFFYDLDPGHACYIVTYEEGRPTDVFFAGWSAETEAAYVSTSASWTFASSTNRAMVALPSPAPFWCWCLEQANTHKKLKQPGQGLTNFADVGPEGRALVVPERGAAMMGTLLRLASSRRRGE